VRLPAGADRPSGAPRPPGRRRGGREELARRRRRERRGSAPRSLSARFIPKQGLSSDPEPSSTPARTAAEEAGPEQRGGREIAKRNENEGRGEADPLGASGERQNLGADAEGPESQRRREDPDIAVGRRDGADQEGQRAREELRKIGEASQPLAQDRP